MPTMQRTLLFRIFIFTLVLCTIFSCSKEAFDVTIPETDVVSEDDMSSQNTDAGDIDSENSDSENTDSNTTTDSESTTDDSNNSNTNTSSSTCTDPGNFVFNEENGLVLVEFEKTAYSDSWALKAAGNSFSGDGYLVWEGSQYLNQPGNGLLTYSIKITNPGTYRFHWFNAITAGNNGTEHNDSWLRFNDADDFYGQKGNSIVYPNGSSKSPNPAGSSQDGWFKIYRSGSNLDFIWSTRTSNHNAHEIYVRFDNPGTYLMEVSARSSNHAIDKFVLFNESWSEADAISSDAYSPISCSN